MQQNLNDGVKKTPIWPIPVTLAVLIGWLALLYIIGLDTASNVSVVNCVSLLSIAIAGGVIVSHLPTFLLKLSGGR